jgi:hypothetical protein
VLIADGVIKDVARHIEPPDPGRTQVRTWVRFRWPVMAMRVNSFLRAAVAWLRRGGRCVGGRKA